MASSSTRLDLQSTENQILLNPRFPENDLRLLTELAGWAQAEKNLKDHVWVATSGSTATSASATKLVALSRTALKASAQAVNLHLQSSAQDKWTQVLPSFHVGGLGIEVRAALSGAQVIRAFLDDRWDAEYFYKILCEEKCTLSALVPTQVYDLVAKGYQAPSSLRAVVIGGAAFDQNLYMQAKKLGWPVLPSYGMTETASQIATASLKSITDLDYPAMSLLSHAQARTNAEGFLEVQAQSLFTCYAQNTSEGFQVWDPKKNDWFTTEDRGHVLGASLEIDGRSKDYIKIGGEGSNLSHLRSVLEKTAFAANKEWPVKVAVLDMPSDRLGSEIHLVSMLSPSETEGLAKVFAEQVLPFEKARKLHYVREIPRSDLGKVLWAELRRLL